MVEIRLYGKLRRYAKDGTDSIIRIAPESGEKLDSLLNRLNIPLTDTNTAILAANRARVPSIAERLQQ